MVTSVLWEGMLSYMTFKNYCSVRSVFFQQISPLAHLAHFDLFCGQSWSVKKLRNASRTVTGVKAIGLK